MRALWLLALLATSCRTAAPPPCDAEVILLVGDQSWTTCPGEYDLEVMPVPGAPAVVVVCNCPEPEPPR